MNEMKLSDFNYELPQELIAQDPAPEAKRFPAYGVEPCDWRNRTPTFLGCDRILKSG